MAHLSPPYGVIDVGTNTFHLLVARFGPEGGLQTLFRHRRFVKLAERGMDRLAPAAMARGLDAMQHFSELLPAHAVERVRAVGTAALRTAANGPEFVDRVRANTKLAIDLVSGEEEARLIYRGVSLAVPFDGAYRLIVDIGGGSVECILANARHIGWAGSFPLGLAVLFHRFHLEDPMPAPAWSAMEAWLHDMLRPLDEALLRYPPVDMVGAAGTFDVLHDLLTAGGNAPAGHSFGADRVAELARRLRPTTIAERLALPEIPDARADLFVLALELVLHLARRAGLRQITYSPYAMKEGILREMADSHP